MSVLGKNVSVDEIIESCQCIVNKETVLLEDFEDALIESEREWQEYCHALDSGDLSNFGDEVVNLQDVLGQICIQAENNQNDVERIEQDIQQARILQNNLSNTVTANEEKLKTIESKIVNINEKKHKLLEMRDKIQVCKLLINTSFVYKGDSVRGYAVGPLSKNIHPFSINPENHSSEEITDQLYDMLKKASSEL